MNSRATRFFSLQSAKSTEINSGPLSILSLAGRPRGPLLALKPVRPLLLAVRIHFDRQTLAAEVIQHIERPELPTLANASCMKSMDQQTLAQGGITSGCGVREGRRFCLCAAGSSAKNNTPGRRVYGSSENPACATPQTACQNHNEDTCWPAQKPFNDR